MTLRRDSGAVRADAVSCQPSPLTLLYGARDTHVRLPRAREGECSYSANPYRRVDLTVTIDNSVSHQQAIELLQQGLAAVPHVLQAPAPEVDVLQFSPAGSVLCVRPYCAGAHYGQVYFDTNRMLREMFTAAGFPAPVLPVVVQGQPANAGAGVAAAGL